MHAIRIHGARDARLDDIPEPELRPGTVKVKVAWAGICGSDLAIYENAPVPLDHPHPIMGETGPKTLGHEFSGHVIAVADDVTAPAVGDLVAVQPNVADGTCPACLRGEPNLCESFGFVGIHGWGGGLSEYVVVPATYAFSLPPQISPEVGALVESLSVAWHAVKRSGAAAGSTALVVGGGPIGLGLLLALQAQGAERIIVSELSASRRELAATLGAEVVDPRAVDVVDHIRAITAGAGADVSFDASGANNVTLQTVLDGVRKGGHSVIVAMNHGGAAIDPNTLMTSEKVVTGSFAYVAQDFAEVITAIAEGRLKPEPLISSRITLDRAIDDGLRSLLGDGREREVKILVSP